MIHIMGALNQCLTGVNRKAGVYSVSSVKLATFGNWKGKSTRYRMSAHAEIIHPGTGTENLGKIPSHISFQKVLSTCTNQSLLRMPLPEASRRT